MRTVYSHRVKRMVEKILILELDVEEIKGMSFNAEKIADKLIKKHFKTLYYNKAKKLIGEYSEDFLKFVKKTENKDKLFRNELEFIALEFVVDVASEIINNTSTIQTYKLGYTEREELNGMDASNLFIDLF